MANMKVVDKSRASSMIYPSLQENEVKLQCAKNDTVPLSKEESQYFPLDFRLRDIVIDSLARKYNDSRSEYPDNDSEDERFLLGPSEIRRFCHELNTPCVYMQKAMEALTECGILSDYVAIHLLHCDDTEINRQKFILLTKDALYLRYKTNKIEKFSYDSMRFELDGIVDTDRISADDGRYLLEYPLNECFLGLAQEFLLMRRSTLISISERHPVADAPMAFRESYLSFLVDAAAAEGKLSVDSLVYLEYLARNFRVSANKFAEWLAEAYNGGYKATEIQKKLTYLLQRELSIEKYYVLFMDILELIVDSSGEIRRPKLLEILKRKTSIAGPDFVANYVEAVKRRQAALLYTHRAISNISTPKLELYLTDLNARQRYVHELELKLLDIGVIINER